MRVLGLDFGMKYIGVAIGQSVTKTAKPLTTLLAQDGVPKWQEIQTLIDEWQPERLILGIPLNMDGTEQPLTFAARSFAKKLKQHFECPIELVDERLSTWEAKERLKERKLEGLTRNKKSKKREIEMLNATAASVLVEQWFSEQAF